MSAMRNSTKRKFEKRCSWVLSADGFSVSANLGELTDYGMPCRYCLVQSMCIRKSGYNKVTFSRESILNCEILRRLSIKVEDE